MTRPKVCTMVSYMDNTTICERLYGVGTMRLLGVFYAWIEPHLFMLWLRLFFFFFFFASDFNCVCSYLAMTQYRRKGAEEMTQCMRRVLMPQISFASSLTYLFTTITEFIMTVLDVRVIKKERTKMSNGNYDWCNLRVSTPRLSAS